jgi:DNA-binding GntR family transcriptional regulator
MQIVRSDSQQEANSLPRGSVRHDLVNQLLAEIFEGHMPAGTRLIVKQLTKRFGLSSTPVREALLELESLGVVEFMHNRGAAVKPFGQDQLREIFQVRRILEVEATRCACGRVNVAELKQLEQELLALTGPQRGGQWLQREMAADRKLHNLIAARCGSARLEEEIHRYDALVQAMRNVVGNKDRLPEVAIKEHLNVLCALIAGDPAAAAAEMGKHINRAADSIVLVTFHGK